MTLSPTAPFFGRQHRPCDRCFDDIRRGHEKSKDMKSSTHNQVEGTAKKIAGNVKEVTGKVVGNPRLQAEGKAELVEGQIQKKIGDIEKVLGN
jgi:uncharacterized protein YjbJ (UPF0337 family)